MVHPADKLRADLEAKKAAAAKSEAAGDVTKVASSKSPIKGSTKRKGKVTEKSSTKPKIARRKKGTEKPAAAAAKEASDNVAPSKSPVKKKKAKGKVTEKSSTKPKIARRKKGTEKPATKKTAAAAPKGDGKTQSKKSKGEAAEKVTSERSFDRDKTDKGDGLRPIERKIIEIVAGSSEPTNIKEMALLIFGEDCGSEGPDSGRTIRNAARMPIKYGLLESAGRGQLKVTVAYKRAKGDLVKLMKSFRARAKKATGAAEASA